MSPRALGATIEPGLAAFSVRDELDKRFERRGRLRAARWAISLLVVIILLAAGFWVWFGVQYGSLAWWSAPHHITYCGWTYVPAPAGTQASVHRDDLGPLEEVTSVPPFFRPVFIAPELTPNATGTGGGQSCSASIIGEDLYFQSGSGRLIEYPWPGL